MVDFLVQSLGQLGGAPGQHRASRTSERQNACTVDSDSIRDWIRQTVIMQVVQNCLSARLQVGVRAALEKEGLRSCLMSGLPGSQPMDIAFAMSSMWGFTQCDVKQFYGIPPLPLLDCSGRMVVPAEDAAAAVRIHMLPRVILCVGDKEAPID